MPHRKILLRYLVLPCSIVLGLIISTSVYLAYRPILSTDMASNLFVGVWAAVLVWGFTITHDFFTESVPILRRARLFKGNCRLNVAYADAVAIAMDPSQNQIRNVRVCYTKPPSSSLPPLPAVFTIPRPVPDSELRAFKYLVKGFPEIDFDFVTDTVALGSEIPIFALGSGGSNYCTKYIMESVGITSSYQRLKDAPKPAGFDYGVITRTTHNQRLAIACWGLGGTGTAGAAWFLAKRYHDLANAMNGDFDTDFVALLKFRFGQETSGQLVRIYRSHEISTFATNLENGTGIVNASTLSG